MIKITGFDGKDFVLNADHIEKIEEVPECIITLTNGRKYIVKGSSDEIIKKVIEYRSKILNLKVQEDEE